MIVMMMTGSQKNWSIKMKKLYKVELNEIHCATFEVEAVSEQDAVNEVLDGAGDLIHTEYSYTPDNDAVRSVTCKEDA